jgi:hypothetical protein
VVLRQANVGVACKGARVRHEWFSKDMEKIPGGWTGKKPIPMLLQMAELEDQGFEIFTIIPHTNSTKVQVIYRRPR